MKSLLRFSEMLNTFREIERIVYSSRVKRQESDAEHSYLLAMLAWYIAETEKLTLDRDKLIKYALIHDLVEVYAGDTYIYSQDQAHIECKAAREAAALERLEQEFGEVPEIWNIIHAYERREDEESKFIYALDKLHPIINVYLEGGRCWQEKGITLEMLKEKKTEKISLSPPIKKIYDEIVKALEGEEDKFFKG